MVSRHVYRVRGWPPSSTDFVVVLDEASGDVEGDLPLIKAKILAMSGDPENSIQTFRMVEYLGRDCYR